MENNYHGNLTISSAPHLVNNVDTRRIMGTVLLALLPQFIVSIYVFGARAFILTAVCVVASVVFEALYNKLMKRKQTIGDLSAVLTGVFLAFSVPVSLPYWIAVIGCFVAIIIVKQLFGGIGQNLVNPANTARIVLFISFASQMTTWAEPFDRSLGTDAVTGATPLALIAAGDTANLPSNVEMFLGTIGGSMGEVSALALLIGGIFLIWRKVISPIIPVCFLATVAVIAFAAYGGSIDMAVFHLCAGGVMLGAFFMATDYVTTPIMPMGKVIFGIGCGLLTMVIRLWGNYPEGVSFSILLMNIITPHIDNFCMKRIYGGDKK